MIIQFSLMTAYEDVATDVKVIFLATFRVWSDLRTWPKRQEEDINLLLQGTLGQVLRSDHTRKVARKVTLTSGTM
ncbi:hypothetical protein SKAU_G00153080 [Synaphobranchus kaupii]|uniref:Uncharacterized protein n=1 Tax=Synaphobranchus kaupii TaxID=118154 RepID=A0A9Q1FH59_SYNKA|nr:hypothetical protein SKAU_G00153080 [Synaphobranchus kaupii]